MIEHELLLLGLLKDNPQHGYDIKLKVKEILSLFAGVEIKSIYYPLRVLEQKGLVAKRVTKPSRRPQRIVYSLTAKGQTRFEELLSKSLLDLKRPQFSLDLSLYFLHYLKPSDAQRRLRGRLHMLNRLSASLRQMITALPNKGPASLKVILEHNLWMLEAEANFISERIKSLT